MNRVSIWEILVIVIFALVVFGPAKLPELSRSIGKSINELKKASKDLKKNIGLTSDFKLDDDNDNENDSENK